MLSSPVVYAELDGEVPACRAVAVLCSVFESFQLESRYITGWLPRGETAPKPAQNKARKNFSIWRKAGSGQMIRLAAAPPMKGQLWAAQTPPTKVRMKLADRQCEVRLKNGARQPCSWRTWIHTALFAEWSGGEYVHVVGFASRRILPSQFWGCED